MKGITVEEDVEQGSDTMINCQYLGKIGRIVLIDDLDTNYIHYSSRSVTSYKGKNMYRRLYRIQRFLMSYFPNSEYMSSEMQRVIDKRIFQSLSWSLAALVKCDLPLEEALKTADEMAFDPLYVEAYRRQQERDDPQPYKFHILDPEDVKMAYIKKRIRKLEKDKAAVIKRNKALKKTIWRLKHSVSFHTGRIITFPGRKIKGMFK